MRRPDGRSPSTHTHCFPTGSLSQQLQPPERDVQAHVAPVEDFCILQGFDLASSGASLVTGRVTAPESLGTAGLLAWSVSHGQLINTVLLEVVQAWLGGFCWPFSTRRPL